MTLLILGVSTALAGVVAGLLIGAIVTALGRKAAIAKAYSNGWWACHETTLPRARERA